MKRFLAFMIALTLCFGVLAGCGAKKGAEATDKTQTAEGKDDGKMKLLVISASLGLDTMYMMPEVLRLQGEENYVLGILYHSASLGHHEAWLRNNDTAYAYFEYDSSRDKVWYRSDCNGNLIVNTPGEANDIYIEDGSITVKAEMAFERHDWDVVITMAGSSEITGRISDSEDSNLNVADVETVMEYANDHDLDRSTPIKFGWQMVWACPQDDNLLNDKRRNFLANYCEGSAMRMYELNAETTKNVVVPYLEGKFDYFFPCGTALQNAKSASVMEDKDIHRDFIHATDYGRLIAAYTWYCGLTGTDIRDCKFGSIYSGILLDNKLRNTQTDLVLTEQQQAVLVESVENAYKNPYQVTQSAY